MSSSNGRFLREFSQLSHLANLIPCKGQRGLTSYDIRLTCIDVTEDYVAIGSSIGVVFLYDRKKQTLQRLSCEIKNVNSAVRCVKLLNSLQYQVAVGTDNGLLFIFQLPSLLPGRVKQLQKFTVTDVHSSGLTCLEWSLNGLKVFSGDDMGKVVCTEILPDQNISRSEVVLEESHKIVQLSYNHHYLLVSTRLRTVICKTLQGNAIVQVGQKERKCLGNFGACFIRQLCKADDAMLYASRPGLRIWKANTRGVVDSTFLFKEALNKQDVPNIDVVRSIRPNQSVSRPSEGQFGPLLIYDDNKIVTWNEGLLYVVDPLTNNILGCSDRLGSLLCVSTSQDEIFVLRLGSDIQIVRIAQKEECTIFKDPFQITESDVKTAIAKTSQHLSPSTSGQQSNKSGRKSKSPLGFLLEKIQPAKSRGTSRSIDVTEVKGQAGQFKPLQPSAFESQEGEHSIHSLVKPQVLRTKVSSDDALDLDLDLDLPPIVPLSEISQIKVHIGVEQSQIMATVDNTPSPAEEAVCIDNEVKVTTGSRSHLTITGTGMTDNPGDVTEDIVFQKKPKKVKKKKSSIGKPQSTKNTNNRRESSPLSLNADLQNIVIAPPKEMGPSRPTGLDEKTEHYEDTLKRVLAIYDEDDGKYLEKYDQSVELMGTFQVLESDIENVMTDQQINTETNSADESTKSDEKETAIEDIDRLNEPGKPDLDLNPDDDDPIANEGDLIEAVTVSSSVDCQTSVPAHSQSDVTICTKHDDDDASDTCIHHDTRVSASKEEMENVEKEKETFVDEMEKEILQLRESSRKALYQTPDESNEDFYSKFDINTSTDAISATSSTSTPTSDTSGPTGMTTSLTTADNWSTFLMANSIYTLALSTKHIWIGDRTCSLLCSSLSGPTLRWTKLDTYCQQIAVSESGWIVWRLYKGVLYAGITKTPNYPTGIQWTEAAKDVVYVAVDNKSAWYIKSNGTVYCQSDLSKNRPCNVPKKIACDKDVVKIKCHNGVVWALTCDRHLLVRQAVSTAQPCGTNWIEMDIGKDNLEEDIVIADMSLGDVEGEGGPGRAWIVDTYGRVWFCSGVTRDNPQGSGGWWQVMLSDYLMYDSKPLDILKSQLMDNIIDPVQNFTKALTGSQGGLVTANARGVWVCLEYKNIINVCRSNLLGNKWELATPIGMASSSKWRLLSASAVCQNNDLIWACQPNGDIYCFTSQSRTSVSVSMPHGTELVQMSATTDAVWCLLRDGHVFVRDGMGAHCPTGARWIQLDLSQLGDNKLIDLCCGYEKVWAVDTFGQVYLEIGVKAPSSQNLPKAWMPIDVMTNVKLKRIYTGPNDKMVWAIDSKNNVWTRSGLDKIPIGEKWHQVPGTQAEQLCVTNHFVWAINLHGEILCRFGVSRENFIGYYWKKIPGNFSSFSATPNDELWAISKEGQLHQRKIKLICHQMSNFAFNVNTNTSLLSRNVSTPSTDEGSSVHRSVSTCSDGDWEII